MPFTEAEITGLIVDRRGADLLVRWASSAPEGTTYQVYLGSRLAWSGRQTRCVLPMPGERSSLIVGRVDPGEESSDRSGDPGFPAITEDRARLAWLGGTYLGDGLRSFAVYGESTPGAGIDYTTMVGSVAAYASDPIDGAGLGPAGEGGAGRSAGEYGWTSPPKTGGTWAWGVRPRDVSGLEGTAVTGSTVITAPPRPARDLAADAVVAGTATLTWQQSPDHEA